MSNSCLILCGEKSGEDHVRSFFSDLKDLVPDTEFYGVGGDFLESQNVELVYHLKEFSSWGISEVLGKIPFYKSALDRLTKMAKDKGTKTAILVDFQDFNLRLARRLSKEGVKVLYYVAPQAWAWRPWRAGSLAAFTHTLFTILPFEKKWFMDRGVRRTIGIKHPLYYEYGKIVENASLGLENKPFNDGKDKPIKLLILPGSRKLEIKNLLPHFMETVSILKKEVKLDLSLVKSSSVDEELFAEYIHIFDKIYSDKELSDALTEADLSLAASGTVTLSCALFEVPTVVCYQASLLTEMIGDLFVTYDGPFSLANIFHEEMVYPELKQTEVYAHRIALKLKPWIEDASAFEKVKKKLSKTIHKIKGDQIDIADYISKVIKGEL